ncbi:MAG: polysaccharide deacetylase family protein, partial [Promethearchaeota archaeon]
MYKAVTVILHWNTDYAEIPRAELPNVIKKSYTPTVQAFDGFEGTVCFNLTGHTTDYLLKQAPELIDQIKDFVKTGIVDPLATGYSHPILPLLPQKRIRAQLKTHIEQIDNLFGRKPQGAWPPELAISPLVLDEMSQLGIEWVTIDKEHLDLTQVYGNDINLFERREPTVTEVLADAFWAKGTIDKIKKYRRALKKLNQENSKLLSPLQRVFIQDDKNIRAFLSSQSWWNATKIALAGDVPIYSEKKHFKAIMKSEAKYLPLYTSDVEFFGYRELGGKIPTPEKLVQFLNRLQKQEIVTVSPSEIPLEEWPSDSSFIGSGSWAPDKSLRLWSDSEDNRDFSRRMSEIYQTLDRLGWDNNLISKLLPFLRIIENSDVHGWKPIPERKHEGYSALLSIYKILDEK